MDNITVVLLDPTGKTLSREDADARTFSSGKTGFGAYGKVTVNGERYQLSFNLVKIVPKQ